MLSTASCRFCPLFVPPTYAQLGQIPKSLLSNKKQLAKLDISGNQLAALTPELVESLAAADSVTDIDLSDNAIASVAKGAFANKWPKLQTLVWIGGCGVHKRAEFLFSTTSLSSIDPSGNAMASVAKGAFANKWPKMQTLIWGSVRLSFFLSGKRLSHPSQQS